MPMHRLVSLQTRPRRRRHTTHPAAAAAPKSPVCMHEPPPLPLVARNIDIGNVETSNHASLAPRYATLPAVPPPVSRLPVYLPRYLGTE
ncbi:hypothetical protein NOR_03476 [Metarhizium rileyi]|uniref:Uncharacterized protein n=1 Tax=Metarhizium rileyi (strain RCEF 4871) TaxID=1649241 RepID=A0A167FSF3_METRR|nr:hypothetical protein NOR_03476 [Metarhizium rileyi RCEF 4871]